MKPPLPYRIIFDSKGIIAVHRTLEKLTFSLFLYRLMYVNSNSGDHYKNHIITSKKSHEIILTNLVDKIEPIRFAGLEASIRPQDDKDLEKIEDEIQRIWEYAVLKTTEIPYNTAIFTDKTLIPQYTVYKERDKKENIIIFGEDAAKEKIVDLFNFCQECKH